MPEPPAWRYQKILLPMWEFPAPHCVFTHARVLTMVGDEAIEDGFAEVENGKIKAAGWMANLGETAAEVVDCSGKTVMPGLIQSHAHLAWDGIHDLARQSMDDAPEISAYKSASNMLKNLRAGVTLFRDLGMNKSNFFAKQAVEQGIFPGPRLLICGEAIIQTGGHTYWCCREASGADEMRRAVREQVRGGADLIKIMACHDTLEFTDAELEAVIDESHRNGLPITAHATYDACIARVAAFGVDCIEHGGPMSETTIQLLVDRQVPIVTTFAPLAQQADETIARKFNIPEWKIEERKKAVANPSRYTGLVNAAKAGVPIAFGTDAGSPAVGHDVIAPELKFMVRVGVVANNLAALRSITAVAARVNRMEDKLGTLEAGKEADLIVIDGDPAANLDDIASVTQTIIAGKQMLRMGS
ncbi:MAG: amidohydrolase family protein [Anaerolineae bacterium]|nr:amidohydrolase family protein [Anaerolineae bacterium]